MLSTEQSAAAMTDVGVLLTLLSFVVSSFRVSSSCVDVNDYQLSAWRCCLSSGGAAHVAAGVSMSLRQSRIAVQPLLSLLLLSCWLLAAAQRACGAGPSCSWPSAPDELVKTGSPAGSAWGTVGTNTFYQVRLQVPRTVQVTAIQLRMWSSAGQGRIIGRAGLYDSSSTLLQQSLAVNVSEAGLVWLDFPLQEALTLPAGDYSARPGGTTLTRASPRTAGTSCPAPAAARART